MISMILCVTDKRYKQASTYVAIDRMDYSDAIKTAHYTQLSPCKLLSEGGNSPMVDAIAPRGGNRDSAKLKAMRTLRVRVN